MPVLSVRQQLTPAVLAIVIVAGALHACWKAVIKQVADRLMAFA